MGSGISQEFSAIINKNFVLAAKLGTRLLFYGVWAIS